MDPDRRRKDSFPEIICKYFVFALWRTFSQEGIKGEVGILVAKLSLGGPGSLCSHWALGLLAERERGRKKTQKTQTRRRYFQTLVGAKAGFIRGASSDEKITLLKFATIIFCYTLIFPYFCLYFCQRFLGMASDWKKDAECSCSISVVLQLQGLDLVVV